jgi:hypothetical protein
MESNMMMLLTKGDMSPKGPKGKYTAVSTQKGPLWVDTGFLTTAAANFASKWEQTHGGQNIDTKQWEDKLKNNIQEHTCACNPGSLHSGQCIEQAHHRTPDHIAELARAVLGINNQVNTPHIKQSRNIENVITATDTTARADKQLYGTKYLFHAHNREKEEREINRALRLRANKQAKTSVMGLIRDTQHNRKLCTRNNIKSRKHLTTTTVGRSSKGRTTGSQYRQRDIEKSAQSSLH